MTQALITKQYLTDIANAIRQKASTERTYLPEEMAAAILELRPASLYNVVAGHTEVALPVNVPTVLDSHAMPIHFERTAAKKT